MFLKCKTDKGMVRSINEDYVLSFRSSKYTLLIVADGMGGHNAGEIASKLAATSIREFVLEKYTDYEEKLELLRDAIVNANKRLFIEQQDNDALKGMGTTTTCCIIVDDLLYLGHVGDSRAYIIDNNGIRKITEDHSYVQELIRHGGLTEVEALNHPKKNMITRAVGTEDSVVVDTKIEKIISSDLIIICSDGLTNYISDDEMYKIATEFKASAVDELVRLANERGGRDNISVIIAGLEE